MDPRAHVRVSFVIENEHQIRQVTAFLEKAKFIRELCMTRTELTLHWQDSGSEVYSVDSILDALRDKPDLRVLDVSGPFYTTEISIEQLLSLPSLMNLSRLVILDECPPYTTLCDPDVDTQKRFLDALSASKSLHYLQLPVSWASPYLRNPEAFENIQSIDFRGWCRFHTTTILSRKNKVTELKNVPVRILEIDFIKLWLKISLFFRIL
jgi:hypothetical protein